MSKEKKNRPSENSTIYLNQSDFILSTFTKLELFQLASDLWPTNDVEDASDDDADIELSLEEQIKKEVQTIKKPGPKKRFSSSSRVKDNTKSC